jgi:hypothetical protein
MDSFSEQFQYFSSVVDGIVTEVILKRIKSESSDIYKRWLTPAEI